MRSQNLMIFTLAALILSAPSWAGFGSNSKGSLQVGGDSSDTPPPPQSIGKPVNTQSGDTLAPSSRKHVIINEMNVLKINGTVMVEHEDKTKPTPLQTGSIVEKGDVITVYGDSWVVLKTHRGDEIGLDGNTNVTIDECFMEGPDRQIRLLVQKGTLFLRTHGDHSRQSFFEINMGNVVASIDSLEAIMNFDPAKSTVDIKYITGEINVIDQNHEENFKIHQGEYNAYTKTEADNGGHAGIPQEHTEHTWVNGKMAEEEPTPLEEIDEINFRKFFDGEPPLVPEDSNMLLDDSQHVPFRQR